MHGTYFVIIHKLGNHDYSDNDFRSFCTLYYAKGFLYARTYFLIL